MIDYDITLKFDITSLECEPESLSNSHYDPKLSYFRLSGSDN